jgi:predicted transcriptional regulator
MADLSITTSEVQPGTASTPTLVAGEAIDAGEVIYKKAADGEAYLADADAEASAEAIGIAVCSAAAGQKVAYQKTGTVTIGSSASVAQGQVYVVSGTAGKIAPEGDLATDDYVTILGVGNDADGIDLDINATGIAHV